MIFPLKGLDLGPYLSIDRLASTVDKNLSATKVKMQPHEIQSINIPNSSSTNVTCTSSLSDIDSADVDPSSCININSISNGSTGIYDFRISSNSKNNNCSQSPEDNNMNQGDSENTDEIDRNLISLPLSTVEQRNNNDTTETCKIFDSNDYLPIYDLMSVSNHCGTLNGGHYIAHVDTTSTSCTHIYKEQNHKEHQLQQQQQQQQQQHEGHNRNERQDRDGGQNTNGDANHQPSNSYDNNCPFDEDYQRTDCHLKVIQSQPSICDDQCNNKNMKIAPRWMCFNDEHVSPASSTNIVGPSAYVLFYRLRES